ncbi:hypothetical protein [Streptomyces sp. KL116D]|uniref:hypothetical protein n=1 Tax=Streptomyces sp. KL116D TaxID=3045152 RepID=UPI0035571B90
MSPSAACSFFSARFSARFLECDFSLSAAREHQRVGLVQERRVLGGCDGFEGRRGGGAWSAGFWSSSPTT